MRFRRYRVFLAVTVFLLLGIYYLFDSRGWGGKTRLSFKDLAGSSRTPAGQGDSNTDGETYGKLFSHRGSAAGSRLDEVQQIALEGKEKELGKKKGSGKGKQEELDFPHKKPLEGADIDVKLPKGKHDKPTGTSSSTTTASPIRFSKVPQHFPVPEASVIPLPTGRPKAIPRIQHSFSRETTPERKDRREKLKRLKKTFLKHWAGYKEFAWDHDELRPVSGKYQDPFAGWRATLVDTLDMLWIMGLKDEFEEAVDEVATIDFQTTTRDPLPLFEVTIRYLGGLIAAYDVSDGKYPIILEKAKELAEVLMPAFDTPNRMPQTSYRWNPAQLALPKLAPNGAVLAEIGSLSMEFIRLAQITREDRYYDAVARVTDEFELMQNKSRLPGLWPMYVDASGGCVLSEIQDVRPSASETLSSESLSSVKTGSEKDSAPNVQNKVRDKSIVTKSSKGADEHVAENDIGNRAKSSKSRRPSSGESDETPSNKIASLDDSENENDLSTADTELPTKNVGSRAGSAKSHEKRAPPPIREGSGKKQKEGLSSKETGLDIDEETTKPAASRPRKSNGKPKLAEAEDNALDDDTPVADRLSVKQSAKHKDESTFGNDASTDSDKPSPKQKLSKDFVDPKARQHKDKSSFGEDEADEPERPRSNSKGSKSETAAGKGQKGDSLGKSRPSSKTHKDTFEEPSEDEHEGAHSQTRHNKPMHECVQRGLQSQYGTHGIDKFTLGGMADSVYEYLPKSYLLLGGLEEQYRRMHELTMPTIKEYLLFRAMTNETKRHAFFTGDFTSQGVFNNETEQMDGTFSPHTGHLTCFQGAYIALAAKAFRMDKDLDLAKKLTEGCVWAYEQTATGIMPELFDMVPCTNLTGSCKFNETRWWDAVDPYAKDKVEANKKLIEDLKTEKKDGDKSKSSLDDLEKRLDDPSIRPSKTLLERTQDEHDKRSPPKAPSSPPPTDDERRSALLAAPTTIPDQMRKTIENLHLAPGITKMSAKEYILRPEALESVFYMYRITGDSYWRDKGWHMFESIDNATSTEYGNSAIEDVTQKEPTLRDKAESFWTAETLKYLWLLFSEPDLVSLDDWVFNTEAHPFRRPDLDVKREREAERLRRRKGAGGNMVWDLD